MKKILSVFLAVIMLFSTLAVGVSAADFKDTANHWGAEYINYWTDENAVGGYQDGSFRPDNSVTRGEVAQIIANILKLVPTTTANPFKDMPTDAWYFNAVLACYEAGIFKGFPDKTIRANSAITREQAIVLISRVTNVTPNASAAANFVDSKKASSWATAAIGALFSAGVLDGYKTAAGAEIRPQNTITRAEFLKLFATVDKASNIGYTVGNRTSADQPEPNQPIIIPAIAAATTTPTTTYYKATVKIAGNSKEQTYTIASKASASTPVLTDIYTFFNAKQGLNESIAAFGDVFASQAAAKFIKDYEAAGKVLTAADLTNAGVAYEGTLALENFLQASYKDSVGTYTFTYTVAESANTYVVTLTVERA